MTFDKSSIKMTDRIKTLMNDYFDAFPEVEADRAELWTESYKMTENEPEVTRKSKAFEHVLKNIPIVIRPEELIVGSNSIHPRGCQTFPEYSYDWLEAEFDTIEKRIADPFKLTPETAKRLKAANAYWKNKTTSELATDYMSEEARRVLAHNVFTPGNYFYNGIGHYTPKYWDVIYKGLNATIKRAEEELKNYCQGNPEYPRRMHFYTSVIRSCKGVITYANRYADLAEKMAQETSDTRRKNELLVIAANCRRVPAEPAENFYQACQAFWFIQQLLQMESSGHSISPGRFDQYMYPIYEQDIKAGKISREGAQELIDCIWLKLNDINKARDAASAEGFAGYGLFQNLIVGGQDKNGYDVTNDLSFMCLEASRHVKLPQPSLSIRVWSGSPQALLLKAAEVTRTGIGLPAYYNDDVIIPALMNRGVSLEDARTYNIIGCVEPQAAGKTDGWHDAAFFNMLRPLEFVFKNGYEDGELVTIETGDPTSFATFDDLFKAYKKQMNYCIAMMVNSINAIDYAHCERSPLAFESCLIDGCFESGKTLEEGGAIYNFTGPQGFGIANVTDSLLAIKQLVYEEHKYTIKDFMDAMSDNFGKGITSFELTHTTNEVIASLKADGKAITPEVVSAVVNSVAAAKTVSEDKKKFYQQMLDDIDDVPKYGNDDETVDMFAREIGYTYTKPLETFKNPRGGIFQAGLYPVSANVPLGTQSGATPDGRLSMTPIADGVGPAQGRDKLGPTAAANSVARLDHLNASNGTLYNQKFHPNALNGEKGLEDFVALIRTFFMRRGMHVQFNVVSRETLLDAQAHPEKYKSLVVRVAGYSALFTSLSRSLQDDIIARTMQGTLS